MTVATGDMSDAEADRAGLVPAHAYAVLDMRKVRDRFLLKLKNPWSRVRWKGHFSPEDKKVWGGVEEGGGNLFRMLSPPPQNWTREMRTKLGYDPEQALREDNGEFWIDWRAVEHFFDVMHLNWDPSPFHPRYTLHPTWPHVGGRGAVPRFDFAL